MPGLASLFVLGSILLLVVGVPAWVAYQHGLGTLHSVFTGLFAGSADWIRRRLVGPNGSYVTRLTFVLAALIGAGAGVGLVFALTANIDASASSSPLITTILEWSTNGWGYVLAALVFGRSSLFLFSRSIIRLGAQKTGYDTSTISRLAEEAKTTDDCTRIIALDDDDEDGLADHIRWGFEGRDERIKADLAAADTDATDAANGPEYRVELVPDRVDVPDWFEGLAGVDGTGPNYCDDPVMTERKVIVDDPAEADDDEDGLADTDLVDWFTPDAVQEWPEDSDDRELTWPERLKMLRMDAAAAIDADDIIWRLLVPAAIVFVLLVVIARIWVWWPLYIVFAALALSIGALVYGVTLWRRNRRLRGLRAPTADGSWGGEVSVLVKRVETDELVMFYGFLAGRSYASTDPDDLAQTLAERATQRLNGQQPAPAIEERWAWCLKRYLPSLHAWEENIEKPKIMDVLANTVLDAPNGIISKERLAHEVIEHDRRYTWRGRRFVGFGHDPELVAECYAEIVPSAIVEDAVPITAGDGTTRDLTVVRSRTQPLPPNTVELETQFSSWFRAREHATRYSLPGLDGVSDAPPFIAPPTASYLTDQ